MLSHKIIAAVICSLMTFSVSAFAENRFSNVDCGRMTEPLLNQMSDGASRADLEDLAARCFSQSQELEERANNASDANLSRQLKLMSLSAGIAGVEIDLKRIAATDPRH
jgi:hypothetical protein